jgi:hypothetical protein
MLSLCAENLVKLALIRSSAARRGEAILCSKECRGDLAEAGTMPVKVLKL